MTKLAFPVAKETLQKLDVDAAGLGELSNPELAAVFVLAKLSQVAVSPNIFQVERWLGNTIRLLEVHAGARSATIKFVKEAVARFTDFKHADQAKIFLMSNEDVANKNYLDAKRLWRFGCSAEFRQVFTRRSILGGKEDVSLSQEHDRLIRAIEAEPEEPVSVQGFAGVGKTHVIIALGASLAAKGLSVVALAHTKQQLAALLKRAPAMRGMTLAELTTKLVYPGEGSPRPTQHSRYRTGQRFNRTYSQMACILGIYSVGSAQPIDVAKIAWRTVASFCHSASRDLSTEHLPSAVEFWSTAEKATLIEVARRMWRTIIYSPNRESELPLRIYHQIKFADVEGKVLPQTIRVILVDEAHDLPLPIINILERTPPPQAAFMFGDRYQHLFGFRGNRRKGRTRSRELGLSVRAGASTTDLFNQVLAAHPIAPEIDFVGVRPENTKVTSYKSFPLPQGNCALIFRSYWTLFEQFQRRAHARGAFCLLPGSERALTSFIEDVIELFIHGTRPSFPTLFRYECFEDLVKRESKYAEIGRVLELLEKGYRFEDLQKSLSRQTKGDQNILWLGMPEHTKNIEFSKVVIAEDFFDQTAIMSKGAIVSSVYTAMSRVKSELFLPEDFNSWVNELSTK